MLFRSTLYSMGRVRATKPIKFSHSHTVIYLVSSLKPWILFHSVNTPTSVAVVLFSRLARIFDYKLRNLLVKQVHRMAHESSPRTNCAACSALYSLGFIEATARFRFFLSFFAC